MIPHSFPNFLIIGAGKSGTSSIHYYLRQHPEIFLPLTKETRFFIDNEIYSQGIKRYVQTHYRGAEQYPLRGEATPTYLTFPNIVIPRIKELYRNNSPKFIVVFRDPVARAFSHFLHMRRTAVENKDFINALLQESVRLDKDPFGWWGYFTDGLYAYHLSFWLRKFSPEKFCYILTDDLKDKPQETLENIFRFLNVTSNIEINKLEHQNIAGTARSSAFMHFLNSQSALKTLFKTILPPHIRSRLKVNLRSINLDRKSEKELLNLQIDQVLRSNYLSDIKNLECIINRDLSHWK